MKLFEVELMKPLSLPNAPRLEEILPNIGRYRFREWAAGESREDITSTAWRQPSHRWLLSRRSDGVGVLQIVPVSRDAVISVTERRAGRERHEELGEVTYLLDRPRKMHLLVGGNTSNRAVRQTESLIGMMATRHAEDIHLYKIICTANDDVQFPFA